MKKHISILILGMGFALFAKEPTFEYGYIAMSSLPKMCGRFTVVPKPKEDGRFPTVKLSIQHFVPGWFSATPTPAKVLKENIRLTPAGTRISYDSAGPRKGYEYRVFCNVMNERGGWEFVDCSKVVGLEKVRHNSLCTIAPVGIGKSDVRIRSKFKKTVKY